MTESTERPKDLPWLTVARLPAALLVLLDHSSDSALSGLGVGPVRDILKAFAHSGGLAVPFFFILSGFILAHSQGTRTIVEPRKFYLARAARILPVYYLGLLLCLPHFVLEAAEICADHPGAGGWARVAARVVAVTGLVQTWVPSMALAWNVVAWSLACEAFFYLLFPFLFPRIRGLRDGVLLTILGLSIVPMVGRFVLFSIHPSLHLNFNPLVRLPEFVAGIALAVGFARGWRMPGWTGLLALPGILWSLSQQGEALQVPRLVVLHAAYIASILWLGRSAGWHSGAFRLLVFLGQASFALYILHVGVYEYLRLLFAPSVLLWWTYLVLALALSAAVFQWVETPGRRWVLSRARS